MVIWGIDEPTVPHAHVPQLRVESENVLADAKAWGFGHGIRQPRPTPANAPSR